MELAWKNIGALDNIPVQGARRLCFGHEGRPIAVFRTAANGVFALVDECPHRRGPLSEGIISGDTVTCPLHNWVISLQDGVAVAPDEGCTPTLPVRIVAGEVLCRPAARRRESGMSVRTTCPYCGVGCGIAVVDGVPRGDDAHPANFGRLCSKGAALKETLALPDRLTTPLLHGREAGWDEALDFIAAEFTRIRAIHGPDAIAFYVSGQFLTEDYYVANKLMKGFIGSGNIDTNSRLCMASSVAGHVRAFGEDVVPGCYEDLEQADLVVLVGSNMAWCHPVLYQRLMAAREKRGTKIVAIDPRGTATAETADLHLPLAPGADVLLFNGLLAHLADAGALDRVWTRGACRWL